MSEFIADNFFKEQRALAESVVNEFREKYLYHKGRDLSDKEKFALAFVSGVKINVGEMSQDTDSFHIHMKTENCGVCWDGTKFVVATMADNNRAE